eukprot:6195756-Amphidinium_carterae.1
MLAAAVELVKTGQRLAFDLRGAFGSDQWVAQAYGFYGHIRRNEEKQTLRESMTATLKAHKAVKNFRFSPTFIAHSRKVFSAERSIEKLLVVKNKQERCSEELIDAITSAELKDRGQRYRQAVYALLQTMPDVTQREMVGLLKHTHRTAVTLQSGRDHVYKVYSLLVERGWAKTHAEELHVITAHLDTMLAFHYAAAPKSGTTAEKWWDVNQPLVLCLPQWPVFQKIMASSGSWADHADVVTHLRNSSKLAEKLFAKATNLMSIESFQKDLQQNLDALSGGDLTEARVRTFQVVL